MNSLMTIAAVGAVALGDYFEAATAMFLFGIALWLESFSIGRARNAVRTLVELAPSIAHRLDGLSGPVHPDADDARNARFLHGHAVEHVDHLHRALDVRDEDELRPIGHRADHLVVSGNVGFVERGIDLVEDAERRGLDLEDGEDERDGRECLLSAAHELDARQLLAGRLRQDVDARLEHVLRVRQPKRRAASTEHPREQLLELLVHRLERLGKEALGLAVHLLDGLLEIREFHEVVIDQGRAEQAIGAHHDGAVLGGHGSDFGPEFTSSA